MHTYIGDNVHYLLDDDVCRPAKVIKVWGPECVQLCVFLDGANDAPKVPRLNINRDGQPMTMWKTSVVFDESASKIGYWHTNDQCDK